MSYKVDGHEYWSARSQADAYRMHAERLARAQVDSLRSQAAQHQQRVRDTEAALRSAHGNLERERELNERLGLEVGSLRRTQEDLRRSQETLRVETDRHFRDVRQHLLDTRQDVADLDRRHEEHAHEVARQFAEAEAEMERGLAEAEARRRDTELRLQAEVRQVDAKVEADRAERLRQVTSDLDRSALAVDLVRQQLASAEPGRDQLELQGKWGDVKSALDMAEARLRERNASAVLAAADHAFSEGRSMTAEADRRRGWMAAVAARLDETLKHLERSLEQPVLRRYYQREAAEAEAVFKRLRERHREASRRFGALQAEAERQEPVLARLEKAVLLMEQATPAAQEQFKRREEFVVQLLRLLGPVVGQLSAPPERRFAVADDRKSALIVRCNFSGNRLELHVPLRDPQLNFELHGYGYGSDSACAAAAQQVMARLRATGQAPAGRVDHAALNGPPPPARAETDGLEEDLRDLGRGLT